MTSRHDCDAWPTQGVDALDLARRREVRAYNSGFNDGKSTLPAAQESARGVETLLARVREVEHALEGNDALVRIIRRLDARWHDNELVTRLLDANAALLRQNALAAGSTLDGVVL